MSVKVSHMVDKEDKLSSHSHQEDAATPHITIDPASEKKLIRKIDLHLIPVLCALLLCAFLDRSVILRIVSSELTYPQNQHWQRSYSRP